MFFFSDLKNTIRFYYNGRRTVRKFKEFKESLEEYMKYQDTDVDSENIFDDNDKDSL